MRTAAQLAVLLMLQFADGQESILLYVPMTFPAEPVSSFAELAKCLFRHPPWFSAQPKLTTDLLVAVSSSHNEIGWFDELQDVVTREVRKVDFITATYFFRAPLRGAYDKTQSSDNWNEGPNAVFFDAMRPGGDVYEKFVKSYTYIVQIETDCCAVRSGWLATILEPFYDRSVQVSGASVDGICGESKNWPERPTCFSSSRLPFLAVRYHVNGNAVYRVGPQLEALLEVAASTFSTSSFDIATWQAAQHINRGDAIYNDKHVYNVFHPVDVKALPDMVPSAVVFAHVPRSLRVDADDLRSWCNACLQNDKDCIDKAPLTTACASLATDGG